MTIESYIAEWYTGLEPLHKTRFLETHPTQKAVQMPYLVLKAFSTAVGRRGLVQSDIDAYVDSLPERIVVDLCRLLLRKTEVYLTLDEMRYALKVTVVKFQDMIPELVPEYQARLARAKKLSDSTYRAVLASLYNVENMKPEHLVGVILGPVHPDEDFVLNFDKVDHDALAKEYGIVIPHFILETFHKKYILNEYMKVRKILLERPQLHVPNFDSENLNQLADFFQVCSMRDVLYVSNVSIPFQNREHYIDNVLTFFRQEKFFKPVRALLERSVNEHTQLGDHITEKAEFICHGTMFKYRTYGIDELMHAFCVVDEETGKVEHQPLRPENPKDKFGLADVLELKTMIAEHALLNEDYAKLVEICDLVIHDNMNVQQEFLLLALEYIALDEEEREKLDILFTEIIKAGMYMRRWQGDGFPYPITEKDTKVKIEPAVLSTPQLMLVEELIDKLGHASKALFKKLPLVSFVDVLRATIDKYETFAHLHSKVMKNKYCIRMASSQYIKTAYYYKTIMCKKVFPGFNPADLAFVV